MYLGTAYGEEVECDFKAIHPAVTTGEVKDIVRGAWIDTPGFDLVLKK